MFDPTDFSYKDIVDNLHIDDVIFEGDPETYQNTCNDVYPVNTTTGLYELSQSEVLLVLNNCEDITRATAKCSLESTTEGGSYEPTLLDDHTVNQFLLPANGVNDENKETNLSPELLALHTCVLCNDIFTSDAELLDHTISRHVTEPNVAEPLLQPATVVPVDVVEKINEVSVVGLDAVGDVENPVTELENDWLVCGICERVLSSATLEVGGESVDQVCCTDKSGMSSVVRRGLHTMYVCSTCSGLFAEGEALDRHKSICELMGEVHLAAESPVSSEVIEPTLFNPDVCFTCDDCGEQYSSAEELKVHAVSSHPAFRPPSGRRPYVRNTSSKMWNCGSCNQLFATARELYKHKRGEDRPEGAPLTAHVCEECDKVLGSTCALHTHRKMHKISKPGYPCRICGRRFNQSGHLAIHMRMHTGERPYPCDLCPKAFKVKVERDDHRRTHTGERPFACPLCPKTFTAAARLREHARIHTDQRPYKCEVCGAAFRRPYARTVHTLIHTGEKPHECDICNTAFRRSGDMWKHKRTIHWAQMEEEVAKR